MENTERLEAVEKAVVQINHFTEEIAKLNLAEWKGAVSSDLRWLKYLLGIGALAGVFDVIVSVLK